MKKIFGKIFRLPIDEKSSRGGFTLVEVVVALAVIVIVTGISIGVVSVDNKTHVETVDMIEATNIAENAIECFRFAVKNPGAENKAVVFYNLFSKSLGPDFSSEAPEKDASDVYRCLITNGRVEVQIAMDFDEKTITISADNDGTNEYLIEEVTYTVR